jgi:hypothetical protein
VGSSVGLAAVDTPLYSGALLRLTGGIDLSFLISGAIAAAAYVALSARRPHPVPALEPALEPVAAGGV